MQEGDQLEITVDKFADQARSLARVDGLVVFIPAAVPGDRIRARLTKKKRSYAEAELLELLDPSPLRTTPRCVYADTCGGCQWQHVRYKDQLAMKEQNVADALTRTGRFSLEDITVYPIQAADTTFYYRNKMAFSFSSQRWLMPWEKAAGRVEPQEFALGLHPGGEHNKVLDLEECYLQSPLSMRLVNELRSFCREHNWEPWDADQQKGYLKRLILRMAAHGSDLMVHLVTDAFKSNRMDQMAAFLQQEFPAVTSFVNSVDAEPAKPTPAETQHTIFGPGTLRDKIGRFSFDIDPHTFFQPNTRQAEKLYQVVEKFGAFQSSDLVYDLFCGIGTLSSFIAGNVQTVIGIEALKASTDRAEKNARLNKLFNCRFYNGEVKKVLSQVRQKHGRPDVVVCDPPRAGLDRSVVSQLIKLRPKRIVYVSCDPQTQARDLKRLRDNYTVEAVQPVDLFPHTYHIENVAKLSIKE